ncbi:hypothetical protein LH935_16455 [Gordonia polyisoprenivorans]|uniref:hypothetical protein n=1 Tax=Gordonia polyisoprenivorans TaxID=84595 RepID=UPI00223453BA|nr:hypothetical protein LH935_16455 [Gordonia polyisoprenivorans]
MQADVAVLPATDARALTDRIKVGVDAVWELIKQAYVERAWQSLGYTSWDDYCTREFGSSRLRLPREERSEVVASLRESGLSIRSIASATGLNKQTVNNTTRELSGNQTPAADPAPITGTDGKRYKSRPKPPPMSEEQLRKEKPEMTKRHFVNEDSPESITRTLADDADMARRLMTVAGKSRDTIEINSAARPIDLRLCERIGIDIAEGDRTVMVADAIRQRIVAGTTSVADGAVMIRNGKRY